MYVQKIPKLNERIDYIDFLRFMALIMVVTIHVSAFFFYDTTVNSKMWLIAHFYDTVSRPAVPIFIMVSGLLQLSSNRSYTLGQYLRKRALRVLVPLFFWAIIYFLWSTIKSHEAFSLKDFLPNLLSGNVYYHQYFLYVIFGLYLITPILKLYITQANIQDFLYAIGLWILAVSVIPFFDKFWGIKFYYLLIPISGYVGYYLAGYFFSTLPYIRTSLLVMVWIVANLVIYFGTWLISNEAGELDQFFYSYTSLSVIASSFTLFIFIKQINFSDFYTRHPILRKVVSLGASTSFSIYLIHLLILEMLYKGIFGLTINSLTFNTYVGIPIIVVIVVIISGLLVVGLRRVPIVRWLLP